MKRKTIDKTYDYVDADGKLIFQVVKFCPKSFAQRRPDGKGGWIWILKGIVRILYRLPEILKAPEDEFIFIVEGEKDADRLSQEGRVATTNSGGAQKWHLTDSKPLKGRKIVIIPDNDEPGKKHALSIASNMYGLAKEIKIVTLDGVPIKADVSDWLDLGHSVDELDILVENAEVFSKDEKGEEESEDNPELLILDPRDPVKSAEEFVKAMSKKYGKPVLYHYAGDYYLWLNYHYQRIEYKELKKLIYMFLKAAYQDTGDEDPPEFKANRYIVNDIVDALDTLILLPERRKIPSWLCKGKDMPNPNDILPISASWEG